MTMPDMNSPHKEAKSPSDAFPRSDRCNGLKRRLGTEEDPNRTLDNEIVEEPASKRYRWSSYFPLYDRIKNMFFGDSDSGGRGQDSTSRAPPKSPEKVKHATISPAHREHTAPLFKPTPTQLPRDTSTPANKYLSSMRKSALYLPSTRVNPVIHESAPDDGEGDPTKSLKVSVLQPSKFDTVFKAVTSHNYQRVKPDSSRLFREAISQNPFSSQRVSQPVSSVLPSTASQSWHSDHDIVINGIESRRSSATQSVHTTLDEWSAIQNEVASLEREFPYPSKLRPYIPSPDDDEEEYDEEDEEKDELVALSSEQLNIIDEALVPHPADEVLSSVANYEITRKDIDTLRGLSWLNDEIINYYFQLIVDRGKLDNFPSVYATNTFFYPKLLSTGYQSVKRWTRKVDIFEHEMVLVPVHLGIHWCLSVIDFPNKTINYYDSMGGTNDQCLNSLLDYIKDEHLDKKKTTLAVNGWTKCNLKDIPQQGNGSDCGVFTCKFGEYASRRAPINFSQANMPYFRKRMVYEIVTNRLL